MKVENHIIITPKATMLNGTKISEKDIMGLYREYCNDYPKFFKMDKLCQLGFIGAEILLNDYSASEKENMAVILFNRNGSLITDRKYQGTIGEGDYFPSPAVFVYTLANIVTGEIAIRHKIFGETSFYILSKFDNNIIDEIIESVYYTSNPQYILCGWVDYETDSDYLVDMKIVTK